MKTGAADYRGGQFDAGQFLQSGSGELVGIAA